MPLYEYQCDACGARFEVIQKFSDPLLESCTKCGKGPVHKQLSSPAIQFKGTGWYITDYAKKSSTEATTSTGSSSGDKKATEGGASSGSETKSSEPAKSGGTE